MWQCKCGIAIDAQISYPIRCSCGVVDYGDEVKHQELAVKQSIWRAKFRARQEQCRQCEHYKLDRQCMGCSLMGKPCEVEQFWSQKRECPAKDATPPGGGVIVG